MKACSMFKVVIRRSILRTLPLCFINDSINCTSTYTTVTDGIAWDWVTQKLYWTDADENDIEIYDPSNGNRKVLFETGSLEESNPRTIVLDPTTRLAVDIWQIMPQCSIVNGNSYIYAIVFHVAILTLSV